MFGRISQLPLEIIIRMNLVGCKLLIAHKLEKNTFAIGQNPNIAICLFKNELIFVNQINCHIYISKVCPGIIC